jgi:ribosomal protein S1
MSTMLKTKVKLRITEVNQSRRRVVGSIRAVSNEERREKTDTIWNEIEVGKKYTGVVKSMTSYGAFVDIGGIDGMIHVSELSWTRIKQPSDVLAVGDKIEVFVISFDKEKKKISLGYKTKEDNPWEKFVTSYKIGDVLKVKVVKLMPFGAFAEIIPGVDGLIHISQITDHRIGLPSEVLSEGMEVDVKITDIDNDKHKVSLSIRALLAPEPAQGTVLDKTPEIVYDTDSPQDYDSDKTDGAAE